MRFPFAALALAAPLAFAGCATVSNGKTQDLELSTRSASGEPLAQAECTLKNDRGEWKAQSPARVQVRRSDGDLIVECRKNGFETGFARLISRVYASFVPELLLWGVGPIVDHLNGAAYSYPDEVSVKMGASLVLDKRDEPQQAKPVMSTTASR